MADKDYLNIVIVGHVDHGKSTLIGRLLYDTDSLPAGTLSELETMCAKRGTDAVEWSFVLDTFQAERDQAITIDTTQIHFQTDQRHYVIIDAPGHRAFLKNMITGAANADAAILVVDAIEGMQEQTRRHAYMLSLLGLNQIAVVVNKMDAVHYEETRFEKLQDDIHAYLSSLNMTATHIIPASARNGVMISDRGHDMAWYKGHTVVDALDAFHASTSHDHLPLRFPVQDVYRQGGQRIIAGRVESGTLKIGDTLLFSPTLETARVETIETWPKNKAVQQVTAGHSTAITLDQPIFVDRGHMGSHEHAPPMLFNMLRCNLFWLGDEPLKTGNSYTIRTTTHTCSATVQSINNVIDTDDLSREDAPVLINKHGVGSVTLRTKDPIALDPYNAHPLTGRLVIYNGHDIVGGGTITVDGYPDQRVASRPKSNNINRETHLLTPESRAAHMGHYGGVFWFTGLSGAGKTTTAMAVEAALIKQGYKCYVLDGDNLRHSINRDLGFSPNDRAENIRRVGEIAALMARAGLIVITSFISPYRTDRNKARDVAPNFHEIFIKASLETCETRDAKGLYEKARNGDIPHFTGISSPYEAPDNPELVIDTDAHDHDVCVSQVMNYITAHVALKKTLSQAS